MRIPRAIEYRLTAWYAAMLFAGLTVLGAAHWMLLQHSVHAETDGRLRERVSGIIDFVSVEADSSAPEDLEAFITTKRGRRGRRIDTVEPGPRIPASAEGALTRALERAGRARKPRPEKQKSSGSNVVPLKDGR